MIGQGEGTKARRWVLECGSEESVGWMVMDEPEFDVRDSGERVEVVCAREFLNEIVEYIAETFQHGSPIADDLLSRFGQGEE